MSDVCPVGCSRCGMFGLWDFLQNLFEKDFQTTVSSKIPLTHVLHNVFTIAGFIQMICKRQMPSVKCSQRAQSFFYSKVKYIILE